MTSAHSSHAGKKKAPHHSKSRTTSGPQGFMTDLHQAVKETVHRVVADIDSAALVNNFRVIQELAPDHEILPMIKANAYGHGAKWAAKHLQGLSGLYALGVATLAEGAEVRAALGPKARKIPIVVFGETAPWLEEQGNFCAQHGLTAVISGEEDWVAFQKKGWTHKIPYEIHFNTGMNRLGISLSFIRTLARDFKSLPAHEHPSGVMSHLAMSEAADLPLTVKQVEKFHVVKQELASILPTARFHLGNSGAIWNFKNLGLKGFTDVVRPGISLYGVPPWRGAPVRNLQPVLTLTARVMAIHRLKPGDTIGYGGTYKVSGNDAVMAAILPVGYADGIKRALSNRGHAWLDEKSTRFLGVVSMDMCAIQCWAGTQVGVPVELIGPHVDIWAQAEAASTIPYELLTSLSSRVKRRYDANFES
jgi:alanine racemase